MNAAARFREEFAQLGFRVDLSATESENLLDLFQEALDEASQDAAYPYN